MKAVVAAFNQEKALVGAFSVITNLRMDHFEALGGTHLQLPGVGVTMGGVVGVVVTITITITITAVRAPDCGDVSTAELRGRLPPRRRSGRARAAVCQGCCVEGQPGPRHS